MNKITKSTIAGTLVMFLAGSSVFAAATSSSTTIIKTNTVNGVTTTTTTTTTKTTETVTTTTKKDPVKKPAVTPATPNKKKPHKVSTTNKKEPVFTEIDHKNCKHEKDFHYGYNKHQRKKFNCVHKTKCASKKECDKRSISKKYRQGWKRVHFPRPAKRVRTVRADMSKRYELRCLYEDYYQCNH